MNARQAWALTKQSMSSWSEDYAPSMGAALSYYTLFSIAPLLIIVIAVAGLFFGADAVRGVIFAQLQSLMGHDGAQAIQDMLAKSSDAKTGGIATLVSIVGLLIGSTTVFNELQSDLDRIWRAPARERSSGIWTLLRTRLLSFGMILGVAFLLTVSLVTSAALAALGKWWGGWFAGWEALAYAIDVVFNFAMLTLVFALIYKMIPRVHVGWRDVWTGAGVTSLLFVLGKFAIGLYLGKSDMTSAFGAAGSMVLVMVWVYWSAQIFLFGAEFTWVYANLYGSRRDVAKREGTVPGAPQEVPQKSVDNTGAPAVDAGGPKRVSSATEPPIPAGTMPLTTRRADPPHPVAPIGPALRATAISTSATRELKAPYALTDKRMAVGAIALTTAVAIGVMAKLGVSPWRHRRSGLLAAGASRP
jgi:membrane protein